MGLMTALVLGVIRDDRGDRRLSAVGKSVIGFRFGLTPAVQFIVPDVN